MEDSLGELIPRAAAIQLGGKRINMSIQELKKELPHIIPPSDPSLCIPCRSITLESLMGSGNVTNMDRETGVSRIILDNSKARLTVHWNAPQDSFQRCPMCRLLSCDRVWTSGMSPYNRYFRTHNGTMQLQLEVSRGFNVKLWFPKQLELEEDTAEIELFVSPGSYGSDFIRGRPWNGFTSNSTTQIIHEWALKCDNNHLPCRKRIMGEDSMLEPLLPTRVLVVGSSEHPKLHLKETHGARGRYLALSHCWGTVLPAKTMTATLTSHLQSINEEDLSRLIRDAIKITRLLGHQYLWVDALCIIQDNSGDWKREAAAMGSVYESAYLTIAATDGHNGDYSPLDPDHDVFVDDYIVQLPCDRNSGKQGSTFLRPKGIPKVDQPCIDSSPLNQRAWVMQERILSRRTLHYAQGMVYWECDDIFQAANGSSVDVYLPATIREQLLTVNMESPVSDESYATAAPGPISPESEDFWPMYLRLTYIWSDIIQTYNKCALTRSKDKLPAVAGLAKSIEDRTGLTYHCGLFFDSQEMVPRQLLWMASEDSLEFMGEAPSWSWAAYDGQVEIWDSQADFVHDSGWFPNVRADFVAIVKELLAPCDSNPLPSNDKELEPTRMGAIVMEGQPMLVRRTESRDFDRQNAVADAETIMIPLHSWPRPFDCNQRSYAIISEPRKSEGRPQSFKGWVCFDTDDYEPEMFCILPIVKTVRLVRENRSTTGEATEYTVWRFLAVQRCVVTGGAGNLAFQRVGYGEAFGAHYFDDTGTTTFTLV